MKNKVYDRIKKMTEEEMSAFIYWVYMNGNADGERGAQDSPMGFFGKQFIHMDANDLFPTNNVNEDLWNRFEETYRGHKA